MPHTPSAWKRLRKSEKRRQAEPHRGQEDQDPAARPPTPRSRPATRPRPQTEFKTTQTMLDRAADQGVHPPEQGRPAEVAAGEAPPRGRDTRRRRLTRRSDFGEIASLRVDGVGCSNRRSRLRRSRLLTRPTPPSSPARPRSACGPARRGRRGTPPPAPVSGRRTAAGRATAAKSTFANAGSAFSRSNSSVGGPVARPSPAPSPRGCAAGRPRERPAGPPPARTAAIIRFSVAMYGRCSRTFLAITGRFTTQPVREVQRDPQHRVGGEERLRDVEPAARRCRRASARTTASRRCPRPSRAGPSGTATASTSARPASGSACTPSRDEPTCSASNGSSISCRCASSRRSVPHLCARLREAARARRGPASRSSASRSGR